MACHEMGILQQQVKDRLRSTVDTWQYNLQAKWGDPRVYQIQKATMEKQDSDLAHDLSRRNSDLLTEAYERQREKNLATHQERMNKTKKRLALAAKPPRSQGRKASRTSEPPPPAHPEPTPAS